jgi:hypothetical protein
MTTEELSLIDNPHARAATTLLGEPVMMWQSDSSGLWYICPKDVSLDIVRGETPALAVELAERRWTEQGWRRAT